MPSHATEETTPHTHGLEQHAPPSAPTQDVIEIESDPEEDERIRQQYRQQRLVGDRRINRPRDSLNRFLNSQGENRNTRAALEPDDDEDDDDLQVVGETMLDRHGPIGEDADFVDLSSLGGGDASSGGSGDNRNGVPTRTAIIRHSTGANGSDRGDDIEILEERTTAPNFVLNLPGGESLRISGTTADQPVRRSFQNQQPSRTRAVSAAAAAAARRRLLNRTARSATNLFFSSSQGPQDGYSEENDPDYIPAGVRQLRQQNAMRDRQVSLEQRREQQRLNGMDPGANAELTALRSRIGRYPLDIQSAFDHAQSLYEFEGIIQSVEPRMNENRKQELRELYSQYRGHVMHSWAQNRRRTYREQAARAQQTRAREQEQRQRELENQVFHNRHSLTEFLIARAFGPFHWGGQQADEEIETQNIIEMIQAREEREQDTRKKRYMEDTKFQQQGFLRRAEGVPEGYSASFDTAPKMKIAMTRNGREEEVTVTDDHAAKQYEEVPACCLCGIELGVGIPDEFSGITKEDRGVSFESLVAKYGFHCPYQSLARPSVADRDLSKRTYVASCGHTFCGRCFARVDNARAYSRASKKKLAGLKGASHPDNYGPKTCPAEGCSMQLRSKGRMKEVFF